MPEPIRSTAKSEEDGDELEGRHARDYDMLR